MGLKGTVSRLLSPDDGRGFWLPRGPPGPGRAGLAPAGKGGKRGGENRAAALRKAGMGRPGQAGAGLPALSASFSRGKRTRGRPSLGSSGAPNRPLRRSGPAEACSPSSARLAERRAMGDSGRAWRRKSRPLPRARLLRGRRRRDSSGGRWWWRRLGGADGCPCSARGSVACLTHGWRWTPVPGFPGSLRRGEVLPLPFAPRRPVHDCGGFPGATSRAGKQERPPDRSRWRADFAVDAAASCSFRARSEALRLEAPPESPSAGGSRPATGAELEERPGLLLRQPRSGAAGPRPCSPEQEREPRPPPAGDSLPAPKSSTTDQSPGPRPLRRPLFQSRVLLVVTRALRVLLQGQSRDSALALRSGSDGSRITRSDLGRALLFVPPALRPLPLWSSRLRGSHRASKAFLHEPSPSL